MKKAIVLIIFSCAVRTNVCLAQAGEWTWMKGNTAQNSTGVFGTIGAGAPANTPPALYGAVLWLDSSSNIWLFGGASIYNTLWKYDISANAWTWINGSSINGSPGVYGTMGVPAAANTPGARGYGFLSWKDLKGDFWIYGGVGYDANGNMGLLNDLWKYSVATNEWIWMNGINYALFTASPDYGTLQVPSATNTPGGRRETTVNWVDTAGNLWFFGGHDNNASTKDDLWKYEVTLNQWVWMAGSTGNDAFPVYGTLGVSSPLNTPGGRMSYSLWKDSTGNFWLFGGNYTADLWKLDFATLEWTWMGGSNVLFSTGIAGAQCISDTSFYAASRFENRACWTDACGNFWLYGGLDIAGDYFSDLWVYRPNYNDWTFAGGSLNANVAASYGIQGVSSPSNNPGARYGSPAVYDLSGNAWIFGGIFPSTNSGNDLWRFVQDITCPVLPNCSVFQVPFLASATSVCEKFCIDFTDQSFNNPTSWQWNFPGGVPSSSTFQNPTNICYSSPGIYDVILITTNANGTDTFALTNYITVYPTPPFPTITQVGYTLTSSLADSYQWQLNGSNIPGASNQSYNVLQTGLYTVVVGDLNGCVNSESKYVLITGIDEVSDAGIFIYPNPSSGIFMIEITRQTAGSGQTGGEVSIDVMNTLGQKVFSSSEKISSLNWKREIDLSDVARGIYFIEIKTQNEGACPDFLGVRKKVVITE